MTAVYTPDHATDEAEVRARTDQWRLGRLLDKGLVRRMDGEYERTHPEVARPFVARIERRRNLRTAPHVNLAIKPKSKRRRR